MYTNKEYILISTHNDRHGKILYIEDMGTYICELYMIIENIWFIPEHHQKIFVNNGEGTKELIIYKNTPVSSFFNHLDEIYVGLKGVKSTYPFMIE